MKQHFGDFFYVIHFLLATGLDGHNRGFPSDLEIFLIFFEIVLETHSLGEI